jgi:hypothetical protein
MPGPWLAAPHISQSFSAASVLNFVGQFFLWFDMYQRFRYLRQLMQ